MDKNLRTLRLKIDEVDFKIINLFCKRIKLVNEIQEYKKQKNIPKIDKKREKEIYQRLKKLAKEKKLNETFINKIFKLIVGYNGRS